MLKYFKNIFYGLVTPFQGMKITSSYIFTSRLTRKYPEDYEPILPPTERNKLEVNMKKCSGCQLCAKACLSKCIKIETMKPAPNDTNLPTDENGKPKKLLVTKFDIDYGLCCYCALCEEACNLDAIYRTPFFDYSTHYRKELLHSYAEMSDEDIAEKKLLVKRYNEEKKAEEIEKKP